LGALCDTYAGVLARLDNVQLDEKPRMADFARLGCAVEATLGWPEGSFLAAYNHSRDAGDQLALEADPIGTLLVEIGNQGFEGTASELAALLDQQADENTPRPSNWPKNPVAVANRLRRLAPNLCAQPVSKSSSSNGLRAGAPYGSTEPTPSRPSHPSRRTQARRRANPNDSRDSRDNHLAI
jgi:putative DNA primase/helicase